MVLPLYLGRTWGVAVVFALSATVILIDALISLRVFLFYGITAVTYRARIMDLEALHAIFFAIVSGILAAIQILQLLWSLTQESVHQSQVVDSLSANPTKYGGMGMGDTGTPKTLVLSYLVNTGPTKLRRLSTVLVIAASGLYLFLTALVGTSAVIDYRSSGWAFITAASTTYSSGNLNPVLLFLAFLLFSCSAGTFVSAFFVKAGNPTGIRAALVFCSILEFILISATALGFAFATTLLRSKFADDFAMGVAGAIAFIIFLPLCVIMIDLLDFLRFINKNPQAEWKRKFGKLGRAD